MSTPVPAPVAPPPPARRPFRGRLAFVIFLLFAGLALLNGRLPADELRPIDFAEIGLYLLAFFITLLALKSKATRTPAAWISFLLCILPPILFFLIPPG